MGKVEVPVATLNPPQTHYFAGVSNGASRLCAVCVSQIPSGHCRCRFLSPVLGTSPVFGRPHTPSYPQPTHTRPFGAPPSFPSPTLILNHFQSLFYLPSADLPAQPRSDPRRVSWLTPTNATSNLEFRSRLGVSIVAPCDRQRDHLRPIHAARMLLRGRGNL